MTTHAAERTVDDGPYFWWTFFSALVGGYALEWFLIFYRAWCLSLMWLWFVVPIGIRPLAIYQAVGLLFIVAVVRGTAWQPVKEDKRPIGLMIFLAFLQPTTALILSYGVKMFLQ